MVMIEMNVSQSVAEYAVRLDAEEHQTEYSLATENPKETEDDARNLYADLKRPWKLCRMKSLKWLSNSGKITEANNP